MATSSASDFRADAPPQRSPHSRKRRTARVRPWPIACAFLLLAGASTLFAGTTVEQQQLERSARIHAQVAALFQSRLAVEGLCHLGPVPLAAPATLVDIEVRSRRLASAEHPLTLACALSTLARSQAAIGRYAQAQRLSEEAIGLLDPAGLTDASVAATAVSMLNLQARYAPAESLAKTQLQGANAGTDPAARRDRLRLQIELSRAQWGLADDDGANTSLEDALAQARTQPPADKELIAEMLAQRSDWRMRRFDFTGAQHDLDQAAAIGADTPQADNARYVQVRLLTYSEQPERAIELAQRLLAERRERLGEDHPDTGRAWTALSSALYGAARIDESIEALHRAQPIVLAGYGDQHPEYAELLRQQSLNAFVRERYASATALARRAVGICEHRYGPTHVQTLRMRFNLASKLVSGPDSAWDSPPSREGVSILEDLLQTGSEVDLPTPYEKIVLATTLAVRAPDRELPRAQRMLREAQSDLRRQLPEHAVLRLFADHTLAAVNYRSGRHDQADARFAAFLATVDTIPATQAGVYMMVHEALIHRALYAMSRCRPDEATAALRLALENDREHLPAAPAYARMAQGYLNDIERHGALSAQFGRQQIDERWLQPPQSRLYFEASARSLECPRRLLAKR
ncbi:MAG: hypothetical protein ACREP7_15875 [Lysobacter sp.]